MTCATKTIQQPNERRACKNKRRRERLNVCADARAMSEKLLEQKSNSSFFLALTRICKNVSAVCLCGRERRRSLARESFVYVCVCVHFPALQRKKGTREGTFSLSLSLSLLLFSLPPRSAHSSFSIYFNIIILCASSFVLSRLLSLSLSSCNRGIFFS